MAGKKYDVKGPNVTAGLPHYRKTDETKTGNNALVPDGYASRDNQKLAPSTINTRHIVVKPSANSGFIGDARPLRTNSGYKEQSGSDNPILRKTKVTKPNK